jgi:hypothetical protein
MRASLPTQQTLPQQISTQQISGTSRATLVDSTVTQGEQGKAKQ